MARDILIIPITTVSSESTFSIGGGIIGKFQSSILPSNAEAKLCAKDCFVDKKVVIIYILRFILLCYNRLYSLTSYFLDCDGSDTDADEIAVELQPYLAKLGSH